MARAFIHQGVWRMPPAESVDPSAQKKATLRVSVAAAVATLALAALHDGRGMDDAAAVKPARIAQPELLHIKIEDRVPAVPAPVSPFRRRAPIGDDVAALPLPDAMVPSPARAPVREAEVDAAGMIRAGDETYRLAGVELPETGRMCRRLDGLSVQCLDRAQSYLQLLVKGRAVTCDRNPQTSDGAIAATCRVGDSDIAEQLVRQGWARAADKPEERFMLAEAAAKKQKLGMWRD
ncbi:MAG: thermonuclease family protein [Beijerinckiaceae bacterium]